MSRPVVCINALRTKRLIFAACLRRAGFSCLCFDSGMDALLTLSRGQDTPAVIFLAAVLPEPLTDGYKVAHLIRSHARFHATALVLLSEHSGPLAQWHAHRVGISHLLPKHPMTQDIIALVTQYEQPTEEISSQYTGASYERQHTLPTGIFVGRAYNRHTSYHNGR